MEWCHLGEGDLPGSVTWLCHILVYSHCSELLGQKMVQRHAHLQFLGLLTGESDPRQLAEPLLPLLLSDSE